MSETMTKTSVDPKTVNVEAKWRGQAAADDQTTEPESPKRYSVGAILFYMDQDVQPDIEGRINQALATIEKLTSAVSPHRWNYQSMTAVLSTELQWFEFLRSLAHLGAAVELGRGQETDPDRLAALKAMVARLPKAVILELIETVKAGETDA